MTNPFHPTSFEQALQELESLGVGERLAKQIICIVGVTYAPSVFRTAREARKKYPTEYQQMIRSTRSAALLKIEQLNRRLRLAGLLMIPVAAQTPSARIATRAYNGLRFLSQIDLFPEES